MTVTTGPRGTTLPSSPRRSRPRRLTETGVLLAAVVLVAGMVVGIVLSRRVPAPLRPVAADLPWLADLNDGQALQVSPATGRVENRLAVAGPGTPFVLAQSPGLLVVMTADGRLSTIDLATLAITAGYTGGAGTKALLDDDSLYAADLIAGAIARIDPASGSTQATWATDLPLADAALDGTGTVWALRVDGRLHRLAMTEEGLADAASPVSIDGAGPAARLVAHPRGVTVIAPDAVPGSGLAVRVGTGADGTTPVPGLVGAVAAVTQASVEFIPVSLLDRPAVILVSPDGARSVDTSGPGCPRAGAPALHEDLAWIPCPGAGLVIAVDRQGRHVPPDIALGDGVDPILTVHAGHLFAAGPDGAGTGITPDGQRMAVGGGRGDHAAVAGPAPSRNSPPQPTERPPSQPGCPPGGCATVPGRPLPPPVPSVTLSCSSANNQFYCSVTAAPGGVGFSWRVDGALQPSTGASLSGSCTTAVPIQVTATNASGSDSASYTCVPAPTVTLSCNSPVDSSRFTCSATAGPAGVQVTWYRDGVQQTAWDGLASVGATCVASTIIEVRATNAAGFASRAWSSCDVPPPPVPQITSFNCESGGNEFMCFVNRNTGSIAWYVNGIRRTSWDDETFVNGTCNSSTTVRVEVSNVSGSDSATWSNCRSGPWP